MISLLAIVAFAGASLRAETKVSSLFGSRMVLQREQPVKIWGWDDPGREVVVGFASAKVRAIAGADGKWTAVLPAMPASAEARTLKVSGSSELVFDDVLVGDVWCLFGRSNTGFPVRSMTGGEEEMARADHPALRLVQLYGEPSLQPQKDAVTRGWGVSSPKRVMHVSAVGYVFASELQKHLKVPVGLIQANWGGSPAHMWIRRDVYEETFPPGAQANLGWLSEFEAESKNYHTTGAGSREYPAAMQARVGALYPVYVQPMLGLGVRGIVYYGCGSSAQENEVVARSWRKAWGAERLPFLYVQTPPSGGPAQTEPLARQDPGFRAAFFQLNRSGRIPDSAMVVTVDTGVKTGEKNIHPPEKRPVGERLALAARRLAYGETVTAAGPLYERHEAKGSAVVVSFSETGGGLVQKGERLDGFALSEDGVKWVWAEASIRDGKVVVLQSTLGAPRHIRYAMHEHPKGNLFNREGLPAAAFATDVRYP